MNEPFDASTASAMAWVDKYLNPEDEGHFGAYIDVAEKTMLKFLYGMSDDDCSRYNDIEQLVWVITVLDEIVTREAKRHEN